MLENLQRKSGKQRNLNSDSSFKSFAGAWESNGILGISFHKILK